MGKITIAADVNAPIEQVWEHWTGSEHIVKWAFASEDWEAPSAENNLRVGGTFKTVMAAKDGSMKFDFGGVYTDVKPNELIAYDLGDGRHVRTTFSKTPSGVHIVQTFDAESVNSEEKQRAGWQSILNNFKKYVESA